MLTWLWQELSIVDATIADLATALSAGHTNSVELAVKHLLRIATYDRRTTLLNSIPIINESLFEAAQASDDRRARGTTHNLLDGIPCTIKDSYKIEGMTVAAGSHAFQNLIANEDAFTVSMIKQAGAVILGRTNMPPMAAGGMQRGVYGRAESPYNADYLTAAFASGSSNGSATATAASFGVFGMGEETISSGRSPASNNGLVAYTPSRGLISIRGNWPLFPTCDTVVPHTRTMEDMFALLDVVVATDQKKTCDFWREQPYVELPSVESLRPESYFDLRSDAALAGKRFGVPKMYIGKADGAPDAREVHTRKSVIELWHNASNILKDLGATIVEVDFPVVTNFEKPSSEQQANGTSNNTAPPHRNNFDMSQLMAYAWDDFLAANGDTKSATSLAQVDSATIFPQPPGSIPDRYDSRDPLVRHTDVVGHITHGRKPTYEVPGLGQALKELESARRTEFEDWLQELGLDGVLFPCNGDVGKADSDVNEASADEAWRNGVLFSNGNCVIRQYGIPTISVPMGVMSDTKMPVNLTFASKAYDDNNLLRYAYAFEQNSKLRQSPTRTPALSTDTIALAQDAKVIGQDPPALTVETVTKIGDSGKIQLSGATIEEELIALHVYVDGLEQDRVRVEGKRWEATVLVISKWEGRSEEKNVPDPNKAMVVVLASGRNGRSSAQMLFV